MKLKLENVARITHAEIELNGITVIAGYNGTGKSTVSKSLYAMMSTFGSLSKKVREERRHSVEAGLSRWLYYQGGGFSASSRQEETLANDFLNLSARQGLTPELFLERLQESFGIMENDGLDEAYRAIGAALERPDGEYERFIIERDFRAVFRDQINSIANEASAQFWLESGGQCVCAEFRDNRLENVQTALLRERPVAYIGTLNVMDVIAQRPESFTYMDHLQELLYQERRETEFTFEEYRENRENKEAIQSILRHITEGEIIHEGNRMRFVDDRTKANIDFSNLASGLKTFVIIQTLIANNALTRGSLLLIDEPEVNLHPEWQLKFAEILVLLHEKLGITMLLNTHSPYFLRAIEIYLAESHAAQYGKYYFAEEKDGYFLCKDVSGETEIIYQALYAPLENL